MNKAASARIHYYNSRFSVARSDRWADRGYITVLLDVEGPQLCLTCMNVASKSSIDAGSGLRLIISNTPESCDVTCASTLFIYVAWSRQINSITGIVTRSCTPHDVVQGYLVQWWTFFGVQEIQSHASYSVASHHPNTETKGNRRRRHHQDM